jgi:hypothetical protein
MSYADVENRKQQLIRKALQGSAFIAEITAEVIQALTTGAGDLTPPPEGYDDLGWLTEDGMATATETAQSDITSFGSTTPTRSDITSETTTLTVTAQETKLLTIGLITGASTAGMVADAGTGELRIDKPDRPSARFYRVLTLAVDESETGQELYMARFLPRAKITAKTPPNYAGGDAAITYGLTFTGFKDSELGYSESWLFGGPGWLEMLADMDVEQGTGV